MNDHIIRAGRALRVLWDQFNNWERTIPLIARNGTLKRWHMVSKCRALIRHDRIMRGEA